MATGILDRGLSLKGEFVKRHGSWAQILAGILVISVLCPSVMAQDGVVWRRWDELTPLILGKHVEMRLAGTQVQGDVIAVRADSLFMDVTKTSNPAAYAKGQISIPRLAVSSIDIRKRTKRWRVVGTVVGAIGGLYLGVLASLQSDSLGIYAAVQAGGVVGGLYGGL